MSFVRKACVALFPTWSLTQLPTHFLEFYWFRMLSWICNFLATNGKGYDNARLSDDIHRGSRQIVTLYLSLIYTITKWTCNENEWKGSDRNFYSSAPCLYLHMQIPDTKSISKITQSSLLWHINEWMNEWIVTSFDSPRSFPCSSCTWLPIADRLCFPMSTREADIVCITLTTCIVWLTLLMLPKSSSAIIAKKR